MWLQWMVNKTELPFRRGGPVETWLQWMVTKKWPQQKRLLAQHQWTWPLMQILPIIKAQRQMAGQMTMSVWHLLTQFDHRCQSDSGPNKVSRLRRRKLHRLVRRKLHVRGPGGCVRGRGRTACEDVAVMTLTEHGRTMLRETQCQSFNAIISSSKQRRRTFRARQLAQLIRCTTARWRWSVSSKA